MGHLHLTGSFDGAAAAAVVYQLRMSGYLGTDSWLLILTEASLGASVRKFSGTTFLK
jgi:hypothetical protein